METCTQYLWFAAEEIADGATEYKCAPPIRDAANREALWHALEEGVIDFMATDHSPCPPEMKHREEGRWDQAWGGIASLGLALPVLWTAMQEPWGARSKQIGEWMALRPARLAGLGRRKGALAPGADADFAVFDPGGAMDGNGRRPPFRHKLSPYLGAELQGGVQRRGCAVSASFAIGSLLASRAAESWCAHEGRARAGD